MKWFAISALLIIGFVKCQDDLLDKIPSVDELNLNNLETAVVENYTKDALQALKQKCANTSGGDEVYQELESKANTLKQFLTDNINVTAVMSELEEAKKTGSMDEVFAKYCAKRPEAMEKLRDITETFKKCLQPDERKSIDMKLNLTEKMVSFLCEKDGDKIAMFIANGGEECLTSKVDGIQECFNKSAAAWPSTQNWQSISLLEADEKVCEEFPNVEECVVAVLEECKVKTPANIIGALFKYLRKNMDCAPRKEAVSAVDGRSLDGKMYFIDNNRIKRSNEQMNASFRNRMQTKCQKNNPNPEAYRNLNISFNQFLEVFTSNVFEKPGDCLALKRETELQMDVFLLNLKSCLSAKEDFLPDFFRNAVPAVFNYLCKNNGRKLIEYKNSKGLQCLMKSDITAFSKCAKPTTPHSSDGGEIILKQSEFCDDVTTLRKCIKKELLPQCSQDAHFTEITVDLMKIADEKCSGCSISLNAFLLLALIVLQLKNYLL